MDGDRGHEEMGGQDRISLKIDLRSGMLELDAPENRFDAAIEKAKELLGSMPPAGGGSAARNNAQKEEQATLETEASEDVANAVRPTREAVKTRSKSGRSSGRPGRIGSFEVVDFGLTEANERGLRRFMELAEPKDQGAMVAVAMYASEKIFGKSEFNYNEVYSLLRLSGIKALPKALDVLISRLVEMQWVARDGLNFKLKFIGRDFVEGLLEGKSI